MIGDGKEVLCTARKRNTSAIPGLKHCPGALPTQTETPKILSHTHTPAENGRQAEGGAVLGSTLQCPSKGWGCLSGSHKSVAIS